MRKQQQEIKEHSELEEILRKALVCRLAFVDRDTPYIVPVNFGYKENRIYVHCAQEGRKMDIIKRNDRVCFEVEVDVEMVPGEPACKWTVKYRSVIGFGRVCLVEDPQEKREALNTIMEHYSGKSDHEYDEAIVDITAILRIDVETMSGKRSKE